MTLEIIIIIFIIIFLIIIYKGKEDPYKRKTEMSFKEAIDLVELPVVTFYNGNKKLNFLLDTGSNISQINSSILGSLNYTLLEETNAVIGIEGNKKETQYCQMTFKYKDKLFVNDFCIHNLDDAFAIIKEESGVQIHGILGSLFFQKYKYILDYSTLIAYSKK